MLLGDNLGFALKFHQDLLDFPLYIFFLFVGAQVKFIAFDIHVKFYPLFENDLVVDHHFNICLFSGFVKSVKA